MHITLMAFMFGVGLDQSSCAIIGQYIGKGDVVIAKMFYKTFQKITITIVVVNSTLIYLFQD